MNDFVVCPAAPFAVTFRTKVVPKAAPAPNVTVSPELMATDDPLFTVYVALDALDKFTFTDKASV
ncbi:hypothetical protein D3C71_2060970 [compost metagenome]